MNDELIDFIINEVGDREFNGDLVKDALPKLIRRLCNDEYQFGHDEGYTEGYDDGEFDARN